MIRGEYAPPRTRAIEGHRYAVTIWKASGVSITATTALRTAGPEDQSMQNTKG